MLFQKRIDRALAHQKKQAGKNAPPPSEEHDLENHVEEPPLSDMLEKNDLLALIFSALVTILPICLIVLLVMVGVGRLFFRI